MRWFCLVANFSLLVFFLSVAVEFHTYASTYDWVTLIGAAVTVIANSYVILAKEPKRVEPGFFGLYFKRKMLEEKAKIARLTAPE